VTAPTRARPFGLRRLLAGLLPFALVVAVLAYLLPQFAEVSEVWSALRSTTWLEASTLTLAAALNLATYGLLTVCATPGLTFRQAMVATEASTAVANTVPAGGAVGVAVSVAMLRSWGFSSSRTTVSLLVTGVWNNFAKLALPVFALVCLALQGGVTGPRVVAALVGVLGLLVAVGMLAGVLRSDRSARRIGAVAARAVSSLRRLAGRGPVTGWERATAKFRSRTTLLLSARWRSLTAATLASHLALFLVLLLSLRHLGVSQEEVGWAEALAVFSFARLLTAVPITPGGVGVVEVALVAGLAGAGGDDAQVVAAVLVFRALTYIVPIPLGVLCYAFWRHDRSWRRAAGAAPRTDLVPEAV
jgi:uncharacterized protein (TIRG00374 family)